MEPQRWRDIEDVYHAALAIEPEQRDAFLRERCGSDDELRQEVDSLLAWDRAAAGDLLDQPVWTQNELPETAVTPLTLGARVGPYQIESLLGAGGMGQVFRAEDTRLRRPVAIKTLRKEAGVSTQARLRFLQEARAASALNHPNIVHIYELRSDEDQDHIVMEFVQGRTLAEILAERLLSINDVTAYAEQIASALAAAHEAGIVHRDLKPGNILLTTDGVIKIIDFGLAKLSGQAADASNAPETVTGMVMGTALYMSPEQAEGKPVDARSDIFSTGVVLYEMLTGRRAFDGTSTSRILSQILRDQPPPIRQLRRDVPNALAQVVGRCLEKEPLQRYASGRELLGALAAAHPAPVTSAASTRRFRWLMAGGLAVAAVLAGWLLYRDRQARWVHDQALPQIHAFLLKDDYPAAFELTRKALRVLPDDPQLRRYWSEESVLLSMDTSPSEARLSYRSYGDANSPWRTVGVTPLKDVAVPVGHQHWRIEKEGMEPREFAALGFLLRGQTISLSRLNEGSRGMVPVENNAVWLDTHDIMPLPDYLIDKFEVTNQQFKKFVEAGGYRDEKYWQHPFRKDGEELPRERAMALFRDKTGRPGPAGWNLGTYPRGQEEYPVSGLSWYEADAYCNYAGKALPTVHHWRKAAGFGPYSYILRFSNFSFTGPARVGTYTGVSAAGAYDMAGNVKEWCQNSSGELRSILGGGWNEPSYSYNEPDAQQPLLREQTFGVRCALYPKGLPAASQAPVSLPQRDYSREKPVDDVTFNVFRGLYAYDKTPLDSKVESVDDSHTQWRLEHVSYQAAYGGEKIAAKLYLPKNAQPPYQTVLWFPGGYAWMLHQPETDIDSIYFDFLLQTGRAVLYPTYKGTYERWRPDGGGPNAFRDRMVQIAKDVSRSVDFLEARADIRKDKLAYYGLSTGGSFGSVFLAMEPRFQTGILVSGGLFYTKVPPEVDVLNFAPRVHMPVLMLNGRYDFPFPSETFQKPLFNLLGTPARDKRHKQFDSGHMITLQDMVREVLSWLDQYLGPVQTGS